jgi:hypothetical protein
VDPISEQSAALGPGTPGEAAAIKHSTLTRRIAAVISAAACAAGTAAGTAHAGVMPAPVTIVTHLSVAADSAGANGHWQNTGLLFGSPWITGKVTAGGRTQVSPTPPLMGPAGRPGPVCSAYQTTSDSCLDPSAPLGALLGPPRAARRCRRPRPAVLQA